jgi:hypothetical protein
MGNILHQAVVVTGREGPIQAASDRAIALGLGPSRLLAPVANGAISFFTSPSGSKVGWPTWHESSTTVAAFIRWLRENRLSPALDWVAVEFGSDTSRVQECSGGEHEQGPARPLTGTAPPRPHHAVVVAGFDDWVLPAHAEARERFPAVSEIHEGINWINSFFIPPCGPNNGADGSSVWDAERDQFIEWLRWYPNGESLDWVEVRYGSGLPEGALFPRSFDEGTRQIEPLRWEELAHCTRCGSEVPLYHRAEGEGGHDYPTAQVNRSDDYWCGRCDRWWHALGCEGRAWRRACGHFMPIYVDYCASCGRRVVPCSAPQSPPPAPDPAWLAWNDGTVVKLAQRISQEGRFRDLPVLADALEEAGCSAGEVLEHCRQAGRHYGGCWVLKLLLARQ